MSTPHPETQALTAAVKRVAMTLFAGILGTLPGWSQLVVNPAQPITNEVTIQPIRVQSDDGSYSAPVFGGPGSYADGYIKQQVDVILAQSGITANWLPVVDYADSFTLNGHPNNYTSTARPDTQLYTVLGYSNNSPPSTPPPHHHPDPLVLNMFFVDIVPQFKELGDWTVAGIAVIDANGIMLTVGDNLLLFPSTNNLNLIAGIVAHEICHNLGLSHTPPGGSNLMATYNAASEQISASQTTTIFTPDFGNDGFDFLAPWAPPTEYSLWADGYSLVGGPGDDDDGDGMANVLEFMLDLNPGTPDNHDMPVPVWDAAGLAWTIEKESDALDDGLTYAIEVSSDGTSWLPAGTTGSGSTIVTDSSSELRVRLEAGSGQKFMRLAVDLSVPLLPGFRSPARASDEALEPGLPRISGCSPDGCGCREGHP